MKKILLLITVLTLGLHGVAQPISGTYKNGTDSLVFNGERVIFSVSGFGGLSTTQAGEGTYERVEDFLMIHTTDYPGDKSSFEVQESTKSDTCVIRVMSLNNYAIQGVLVEPNNSSRKNPGGSVTGGDGRIYLTDTDKTESITVSGMGYNSITFDYQPGNDYLVRLAENDIIENQTVVFQFIEVDDETLSLLLLTDDFDTSKRKDRELKNLKKRARKSNRIDKRFKKEYEPYVRRAQAAQ